jgi:CDP-diacylglycerol--serine O-phosphatidyltransferase
MNWRAAIPNALTLGNLACGVLAIFVLSRYSKDFTYCYFSLGFICLGAMFDLLDGAVARSLKVESSLRTQLDSLADIVTFGVAPAFLLATAYLGILGTLFEKEPSIWLGALMVLPLPLAAAFRLARFNVQGKSDKTYFEGLPSPAAGMLATAQAYSFAWIGMALYLNKCYAEHLRQKEPELSADGVESKVSAPIQQELQVPFDNEAWLNEINIMIVLTWVTTFLLALAMVSRWPFLSIKGSTREKLTLVAVFATGASLAWLTDFQPWVVLATLALYAVVSRVLITPVRRAAQ